MFSPGSSGRYLNAQTSGANPLATPDAIQTPDRIGCSIGNSIGNAAARHSFNETIPIDLERYS